VIRAGGGESFVQIERGLDQLDQPIVVGDVGGVDEVDGYDR
jgi:hypothetical protein